MEYRFSKKSLFCVIRECQDALGSTIMANENESSKRMDLSSGYELADAYYGHDVRVYLGTGVVLSGILKLRQGKFILLQNKFKSKPAMINLDDVSSIS